MAYGTRYRHTYCSPDGKEFEILLQQNNYLGGITDVEAGPIPFSINIENSGELKIGGIVSTKATITFVSSADFTLEELYTTDEQEFKIIHRLTGGGNFGYWEGFVVPNGFSEEMDTVIHYMTLEASDRLSSMQGVKFVDANGLNYGQSDGVFMRSQIWIIAEILKKTGLELPIYSLVDLQPLLTGQPEQGGIYSVNAAFYAATPGDPRNILHTIDEQGAILNALEVGMVITVGGGVNDGKTLTVESWHRQGAPNFLTSIFVTEPVISTTHTGPVTLSMVKPAPVGPTDSFEDPLAIIFSDTRTFTDSSSLHRLANKDLVRWNRPKPYYEFQDGTMMSWDVLDGIATLFNVRIFQNEGRWEVRRINAETYPEATYRYFTYDSEGNFLGREPFGQDEMFDCPSNMLRYLPFGHTVSMDRVLKRVTVKYNYRFKQEGDTFENLIFDGNFAQLGTTENKWNAVGLTVTQQTTNLPEDYQTAARVTGYGEGKTLVNLVGDVNISEVLKGDDLTLTFFEYIDGLNEQAAGVYGVSLYSRREDVVLNKVRPTIGYYELVNSGHVYTPGGRQPGSILPVEMSAEWVAGSQTGAEDLQSKRRFFTPYVKNQYLDYGRWRKITINIPDIPINGFLRVEVVGVATLRKRSQDTTRVFGHIPTTETVTSGPGRPQTNEILAEFQDGHLYMIESGRSPMPALVVTGMFMKRLTAAKPDALNYIPYMYEQERDFTDSLDEINIINSDEDNEDMVGNVRVMLGSDLIHSNQWDSWGRDFGWDSIGMVLAKSIMQMYQDPFRKVDGALVAPNLGIGTRVFLSATSGAKYIMLRGSLNYIQNRFTGTLVQVANTDIPEEEGREPNWEPNGVLRCMKALESGLNTGYLEAQEVDVNPRSNTFLQFRWVELEDQDTETCPIGQPNPIYWGAVPEGEMPDIDELLYYPYEKVDDTYRVEYSNDGSGRYLMLYYLATLGNITSILEVENEESISSWEPLPDVQINGITYKGYRMEYVTGTFTGHPKTFIIN